MQSSVKAVRRPETTDLTFWQYHFRDACAAADQLQRMWLKRKPGPAADALWSGARAIERRADEYVDHARHAGELLTMFTVGQPA